ncbi:MAG: type II toxin-antitoxin system HicA family toxin [Pseudomonadota bacterium]
MSKLNKLKDKLRYAQHNYTWNDLTTLLTAIGFEKLEGDGSRVIFIKDKIRLQLHKPHPQKELKYYAVKQVRTTLHKENLL